MSWVDRLFGRPPAEPAQAVERQEPTAGPRLTNVRAEFESFDSLNDPRLQEYLRHGSISNESGAHVSARTALSVGVAWRCAAIICGVIASMPCDLMVRVDEKKRAPAVDAPFRDVLTVKPNNRQTPGEFKSMLQIHKLQRGNGYAMKIVSRGRIIALWPLDASRMVVIENRDQSLTYRYSRLDGTTIDFAQDEILHKRGLSWDGITGLSVIHYMAEAIGISVQTRKAAAKLFKNGAFTTGFLTTDKSLSDKAWERLQADRDERAGIDSEDAQKMRILEEGLKFDAGSPNAVDAQLIELMGFSRTDVGMFYGVPPHLYGDTDKTTSWGTGIEQQNIGFLQYTINDHLRCWRETLKRDCLSNKGDDPRLYVHFDINGLLQADAAGRAAYFKAALGAGGAPAWMTQNEVRSLDDLDPMDDPEADKLPKTGVAVVRDTNTTTDPAPGNLAET